MTDQRRGLPHALATGGLVLVLAACGTGPNASESNATDASPSEMAEGDMSGPDMSPAMTSLGSETWQGMRVELATADPETFDIFQGDQVKEVTPDADDSVHLMAILSDTKTKERIPYAECWVTVTDAAGQLVFDERMWPMLSRGMGTHYGINMPLPQSGEYSVELRVGPPQAARHPEYSDVWQQAETFTFPLENGG